MNTASTNIKVFPAARRTDPNDPFSRLVSESTTVSIVNRLIDSEGFVITDPSDLNTTNGSFEFNIFGYYFKVINIGSILSSFTSRTALYATIFLEEATNDGVTYKELKGIDSSSKYTGVVFDYQVASGTGERHSLKLLERTNTSSSWQIPVASRAIFTSGSVQLTAIDGGEI